MKTQSMKVLKEQFPYRWCESDDQTAGWIDKFNMNTRRYCRMYDCDSPLQLITAIDDYQYTLWLDPEGVPCYRRNRGDTIVSPYKR